MLFLKTEYTSENCTHTKIHRVKDKKAILKILRQCGKFTLKKLSVVKSVVGMDVVFKLLNVKLSEVHIFSCFMESWVYLGSISHSGIMSESC